MIHNLLLFTVRRQKRCLAATKKGPDEKSKRVNGKETKNDTKTPLYLGLINACHYIVLPIMVVMAFCESWLALDFSQQYLAVPFLVVVTWYLQGAIILNTFIIMQKNNIMKRLLLSNVFLYVVPLKKPKQSGTKKVIIKNQKQVFFEGQKNWPKSPRCLITWKRSLNFCGLNFMKNLDKVQIF